MPQPASKSSRPLNTVRATCLQALYTRRARELTAHGQWKAAEKLYCTIRDYDAAINMYKQQQMYDHMLRLVAVHRRVRACAAEHMVVAVLGSVLHAAPGGTAVPNKLCRWLHVVAVQGWTLHDAPDGSVPLV